jgi:hypothetical protein
VASNNQCKKEEEKLEKKTERKEEKIEKVERRSRTRRTSIADFFSNFFDQFLLHRRKGRHVVQEGDHSARRSVPGHQNEKTIRFQRLLVTKN